jgi:hypothetical protein
MQTQVKQEHRLDNESSDRLTHTLLVNCGRALVQAVDEQQLLQSVCLKLVCSQAKAWVRDCGCR